MIFGGFENFTLADYPGKIACVVYTIGCNFRCPYCHNPELVDETMETKITEDDVLLFLDTRKHMLDGIVITGGEPTMHIDLIDFMRRVKQRGVLVKLDSNGTHPDILKKIISERLVDYIAMDIKAPLATYSTVVARPVDVLAIKKSIDLLMSSHIPYEFRTTVVKGQLHPKDIEQIGKEITGAQKYYLQRFVPTKILNPQFKKKVTYSDEEFNHFQEIMQKYVTYCGIR